MKVIIPLLLLGIMYSQAMSLLCPPEEDISPCKCKENIPSADLSIHCFAYSYYKPITKDHLFKVLQVVPPEKTLEIVLYNMSLGRLPSQFFENAQVKILQLSECDLDGLTLAGLEETLEELNIYHTKGTLSLRLGNLNRLHMLRIMFNSIPTLADDWLQRAPRLTKLVFYNNGIEKLGKRAFAGLTGLDTLWLIGNRFGTITRSVLPNPANKLIQLWLTNNSLTELPNDMFSNMPSLKVVYLALNRLKRIPKETFLAVWEQLTYINIGENPLECDSHLEWMLQLRVPATVYGRCSTPPEKQGVELKDLLKGKLPL